MVRRPVEEGLRRIGEGTVRPEARVGVGADPVDLSIARVVGRGIAAGRESLGGRAPYPRGVPDVLLGEYGPDVLPRRDELRGRSDDGAQIGAVHFPAPLQEDRLAEGLDLPCEMADDRVSFAGVDGAAVGARPGNQQRAALADRHRVARCREFALPHQIGVHDVKPAAERALQRIERGNLFRLVICPLPDPGAEVRTVRRDGGLVAIHRKRSQVRCPELRRPGRAAGMIHQHVPDGKCYGDDDRRQDGRSCP